MGKYTLLSVGLTILLALLTLGESRKEKLSKSVELSPLRFSGKTILITGASTGIGEGIASYLAREGASVILSDPDKSLLSQTLKKVKEVSPNPDKVQAYQACLTSDKEVKGLANKIESSVGHLDGFVSCPHSIWKKSGIQDNQLLDTYTEVFQANVANGLRATKNVVPLLEKSPTKAPAIVYLSDISAQKVEPGNLIYGSSKGALETLAQHLVVDLAPKNIRVNTIQSAVVLGSGLQAAALKSTRLLNSLNKEEEAKTPLKRLACVEDVAKAVAFLLSDDAKAITGASLKVDGGRALV